MGNEQPAMTTDGRRHFSMFKQVDRLVAASEAVPDVAFMHRILALCSLPRTNPGNTFQYKRANGPYALYMVAGANNKLPYGSIPQAADGLDVFRSHTETKPRVVSRRLAF